MKINTRILFIFCSLFMIYSVQAQKVERGPYTLETISDGIYQIQDYNSVRGRGTFTDAQGQVAYNNCSDMYLIVGRDKALMIDLSNNIRWADHAAESLRSLVSEYSLGRELIIAITHHHGDHTGMLYAFADDAKVSFQVPRADFPEQGGFPEGRTTFFNNNVSFDLGGTIVKTLRVEGHTPGSTIFFVEGKDIVFTGDAIGSGSGVWIFSADAFAQYKRGLTRLIEYINHPANAINKEKLIIYSGHSLQVPLWPLGMQYILDMEELMKRIEAGSGFETTPMSGNPVLDTHYRYGTATITWNRAAEKEYIGMINEPVGLGPTHKDKNPDVIKLFDEYTFKSIDPNVGDMMYYLFDPIKHGADPSEKYPLMVVFHGAGNGMEGALCTTYTDCAVYAGSEYQAMMGGAYVLFPKANEYSEGGRNLGTWMTVDPTTGTSKYIPSAAGIIEKVISQNKIDANKVVVGGTSAGGYMTWRFLAARPDIAKAAFLMAPANNPADEELAMYDRMGLPIWVIHGIRDEITRYEVFTGPVADKLRAMKNVRLSALPLIRYGDKSVVRMVVGVEMGQHLALFCVGSNMIYDDGTPYDPAYPKGFIEWLKTCLFDK